MTELSGKPRRRWHTDFWKTVRADVVAGLILLAIAGVAGVVIKGLSNLRTGEVLLYIGLPAVALIVLVVLVFIVRAALNTARQWTKWQADVTAYAMGVAAATRRAHLGDIIRTAEARGWTVYDDEDADLTFVTPDGDEPLYVRNVDANPASVAEQLHELAPLHFPEDWEPPMSHLEGYAEAMAEDVTQMRGELQQLTRQVRNLEHRVRVGDAHAMLAMMAAEATARLRWEVTWHTDRVEFIKDGEIATVHYNQPIDLIKLRKVLGLPRWLENW